MEQLKKSIINEKPKKRKLLTFENNDNNDNIPINDIKEIEFRLLDSGQSISDCHYDKLLPIDILLIKFVICCGLYPHVAIPDEINQHRRDSELYFHIKEKQFVTIHPTSCYSYKPSILNKFNMDLNNNEKIREPYVLLYGNLLETTKQYLVDCFHVPALNTLLLVANSIDTDSECSRIVIDDWLEFTFLVILIMINVI